ncbi:helix-turn-helix domain-containing protein [Rathayibacter sp. VKM Ac-2760]|nr:helix-turn-helix domain-containing protein [Rathayibacter sp. VKM Ac-2760]
MGLPSQVREFLTTRRARITPEKAGLPAYGGNRRVAGLRREEVAMLAGVSVDYYNRLERGNLAGVSESVLDALARALQLDEAERTHLLDLARAASLAPAKRRTATTGHVTAGVQRLLDAITEAPAWIRNDRHDLLATNALGRALYADMIASPYGPPNTARFVFLDVRSRDFFPHWEKSADDVVAILRSAAGRNPYDRELSNLVGELSTRSETFRTRWAKHDVRFHRTGTKRLHHALVGDLDLDYEAMTLDSDSDLTLLAYTARPGTPSADALRLLATLAATRESEQAAELGTDAGH